MMISEEQYNLIISYRTVQKSRHRYVHERNHRLFPLHGVGMYDGEAVGIPVGTIRIKNCKNIVSDNAAE